MVYRESVQNNKRDIEPQNYEMNLLGRYILFKTSVN